MSWKEIVLAPENSFRFFPLLIMESQTNSLPPHRSKIIPLGILIILFLMWLICLCGFSLTKGAKLLENYENGLFQTTDEQNWWTIAEENSEVYVRRVKIYGSGL